MSERIRIRRTGPCIQISGGAPGKAKALAVATAKRQSEKLNRTFVARDLGGKEGFYVCPLFEMGRDGKEDTNRHDAGYSALGVLVSESIPLWVKERQKRWEEGARAMNDAMAEVRARYR